jgi:hypothetical protein
MEQLANVLVAQVQWLYLKRSDMPDELSGYASLTHSTGLHPSYRRRPATIFAYTRRPKKTWIPAIAGMTKRRADIERKILNLAN